MQSRREHLEAPKTSQETGEEPALDGSSSRNQSGTGFRGGETDSHAPWSGEELIEVATVPRRKDTPTRPRGPVSSSSPESS